MSIAQKIDISQTTWKSYMTLKLIIEGPKSDLRGVTVALDKQKVFLGYIL